MQGREEVRRRVRAVDPVQNGSGQIPDLHRRTAQRGGIDQKDQQDQSLGDQHARRHAEAVRPALPADGKDADGPLGVGQNVDDGEERHARQRVVQ